MKDFFIKNAKNYLGREVAVKGWVYNKRSGGSIVFLQLRDGTGFIQGTVLKNEVIPEVFAAADKVTLESSVEVKGLLHEEKRSPTGYELGVKEIKIYQLSEEFPIGKKEHGPDFLLQNRHLWLRSKRQWAILQIRNTLIDGINEFMQRENFIKIDSPMITPSACEGTTTLFEIDYFGEKAYLSQSGQLYLEAAIGSVGRCYDFGPALRAEKSKTRRHLIEFWIMDAEMAFVSFEEMLILEENLVQFLLEIVLRQNEAELRILERNTETLKIIKTPYQRMTFADTVKKLRELGSDIKDGEDFGNDDETLLMNHYKQPIFVTHYPAKVKAFYCKRDAQNSNLALSADLLMPEGYGEIVGGGEREDDYAKLLQSIEEHNYKIRDYDWYLDLRKYGSVPHSGFGIGLERLIAWICKLDHVRETIPFPRTLERAYP